MLRKTLPAFLAICVAAVSTSFGQIDPGFSPVITGFPEITSTAIQADGKIIVTGDITRVDGMSAGKIVRLNADGTLDNTFSVTLPPEPVSALFCTIDRDGKLLIGGRGVDVSSFLLRFNPDGTQDHTFSNPEDFSFTKVVPLADGRYLGLVRNLQGIVRLNNDGSVDGTFNPGDGFNAGIFTGDIAIQSDGKAIVVGWFMQYNGNAVKNVVRINTDGTFDNTFQTGTGMSPLFRNINAVAILNDKIFLAGSFQSFNSQPAKFIVKLNEDGSVNNDFIYPNPAANLMNDMILMVRAHQGKLVLGGIHNGDTYRLAMINADGTAEPNFPVTDLHPGISFNESMLLQINSDATSIFVNGSFDRVGTTNVPGLLKIDAAGNINSGFTPSLGGMATIKIVKRLSNGKLLIGGDFNFVNDVQVNRLALLNPDGTPDATFNNNLGSGFDNEVTSLLIQDDGKILVGGRFKNVNGTANNLLIRLNANGTIDNSFLSPITGGNLITSLQQLAGNEILVGGEIEIDDGQSILYSLLKFSATGVQATSFSPSPYQSGSFINGAGVQSNGNIVVIGTAPPNTFLRIYSPTGAILHEYIFTNALPSMVKVLNDDSILVPTRSSEDGGRFPIYQFSKEGELVDDQSITVRDGYVFSIEELPGGNLLLAGMFAIGADRQHALVKVKRTGEIDPNFNFNLHFYYSEAIYSLLKDEDDGQWFVAGSFTKFNQQQTSTMIKVDLEALAPPSNLTATAEFEIATVNLSWADHAGAEHGYSIFRSEGGAFLSIDSVAADNIFFADQTALPGKDYTYQVVAFGHERESLFSNTASASTGTWTAPSQPGSLGFEITGEAGAVTLTWTDTNTETGYEVERSINNAAFVNVATTDAGATAYNTHLDFETSTRYRVRAFNRFGWSDYTTIAELPNLLAPPSTPIAESSFTYGTITLRWLDNSSRETGYAIYRSEGSAFAAIDSVAPNISVYVDDSAVPKKTYSYKVVAFTHTETSPASQAITISTSDWHPPLKPEQFSYNALPDNFSIVRLFWSQVPDALYYTIERSINGAPFLKLADRGQNENYDDPLQNGIIRYRIRAYNVHGPSPYSSTIEVVIPPTNLTLAKDNANGVINLSWKDNDKNEDGFVVYRSHNGIFIEVDRVAANVTNFKDLTAMPLLNYIYKVAAFRGTIVSDFSQPISESTHNWVAPPQPKNLDFAYPDRFNTVVISWTDVSDESGYELERSVNGASFLKLSNIETNVPNYTDEFMFEASVRYRVRAINKFGNSPYSDVIELPLILGTSDRSDPTVSVYPNPFTNHLTIGVAMLDDEHEGLMYTIQGKPIRNFRLTENETVIDLADLPRGIYYLKLRLMTTHTFKVVKQ